MAAFACFSSSKEKSIDTYKLLIKRFREDALSLGPHTTYSSLSCFAAHKGKTTHCYKDFLYQLRKYEFGLNCIIMCDNPSPELKKYILVLEEVKLQDGRYSCAYYGEIKKIITGFLNYFTDIIDEVVKQIDKYSYHLDNDIIMSLIDNTIDKFKDSQENFLKEFPPLDTPLDKKRYDEIIEKHAVHLEMLNKFKESWVLPRQNKIDCFIKENFEKSLKNTNALLNFTHTYMAMMLSDRLFEIAVSVGQTVDRMNTNKRLYNEQCNNRLNMLLNNLYEKNKENLHISRRHTEKATDNAEVDRAIDVLKAKIEEYGNEETIARLQLETEYWNTKLKNFDEIANVLLKIRIELEKLEEETKKYNSLRTTELPGSKAESFKAMGVNMAKRKRYLEVKFEQMSRTLMTFFCVRGTDRILYTDNIGSYYCDEFNHQNYQSAYGLKFYHVNCYGDFLENIEADPYYFDDYGRYTLVNGEKIHQCAPCTSQYKLGEDGLLKKITKDCGHSEKINDKCRLEIKDLTDVEILPTTDILDIKGTLDAETVKYLWDSFGLILPEVLYELGTTLHKNPIHHLAHLLVKRRCEATNEGLRYLKKEADKYRKKVHKERKAKAAGESKAWRSKFVKRRKPEESDDALEWATYNQQVADWAFVNSLGYYN